MLQHDKLPNDVLNAHRCVGQLVAAMQRVVSTFASQTQKKTATHLPVPAFAAQVTSEVMDDFGAAIGVVKGFSKDQLANTGPTRLKHVSVPLCCALADTCQALYAGRIDRNTCKYCVGADWVSGRGGPARRASVRAQPKVAFHVWCLDASAVLAEALIEAKCSVFMSGTIWEDHRTVRRLGFGASDLVTIATTAKHVHRSHRVRLHCVSTTDLCGTMSRCKSKSYLDLVGAF